VSRVLAAFECSHLPLRDIVEADRTLLWPCSCQQSKTACAIVGHDGRESSELGHVLLRDLDDVIGPLVSVSALLLDLRDCLQDAVSPHGVDDVKEIFLVRQPAPRVSREVPVDGLFVPQLAPDALG